MALDKGPGGIGAVVWLATRTVRSAEETGAVPGLVSKSFEDTASEAWPCSRYQVRPHPWERQRTPTATG